MHLAHIRAGGEVQTLQAHCLGAAQTAGEALKSVGLYHCGYLAGLLHDMGKAKGEFARYLEAAAQGDAPPRGSVNHTFAAVRFLLDRWHPEGQPLDMAQLTAEVLAYAAGAHHGLFDCIGPGQESGFFHRQTREGIGWEEALSHYLAECADLQTLDALFQQATQEITGFIDQLAQLSQHPDAYEANRETTFYIGLLTRLVLSAVIDGDRQDTAAFMNDEVFPHWPEDMGPIWSQRLAFLEEKLEAFPADRPIQQARRAISQACADFASRPGGIYRLNVPTGGGKTLASLRFALAHGKRWNKSRILFTSPLLSILDQNAQVLRQFIGDDSLILEHHSNLAEPEGSAEELQALELLTQTWQAPVIITTLVQLLNTCFSGKTSAIRRFHALSNSILVIDEVQTVPGKMLTLFNLAMNFLAKSCGATILLCSATQPELHRTEHPLWQAPEQVVPYQKDLWEVFRRTRIQDAGHLPLEQIPDFARQALAECQSLLLVCNTKQQAAFLYRELQDGVHLTFHLSAAMCITHRRQTLQQLQEALDAAREKVLCISTQVIEAGVDISFQQVIRLTAGMDSIQQAAGRCNRHAQQAQPAPVSILRCSDERLRHLPDILRGQTATTALLTAFRKDPEAFQGDLASQEATAYYYRQLYANMPSGFQDYSTPDHGSLYHLLADNPRYADANSPHASRYFLRQAFQLAGKAFQVFEENTREILVPYGRGRELGQQLLAAAQGHDSRDWAAIGQWIQEARGYSVSVYPYQWEKLQQYGAVTSLFGGSLHILSDGFYDDHTGFSLETGISGFQEV